MGVNRISHGAFTLLCIPFEVRAVVADVNRVEIDCVLRIRLAELLTEVLFSEATGTPRRIQSFAALAMKTALGLDLLEWGVHKLMISTINSLSPMTRRSLDSSSARA